MTKAKNKRRTFLYGGLSVLGGLLLGRSAGKRTESHGGSTVRMMTAEGKMVEIDQSRLSGLPGNKVSNTELKKWMATENPKS